MKDSHRWGTAALGLVLLFSVGCSLLPPRGTAPLVTPVPPSPIPADTALPEPSPFRPTGEAPGATAPLQTRGPLIVVDANPDNNLLFCAGGDGGIRACYHGAAAAGKMQLRYVVLEGSDGEARLVVFDEALLPVQWILPQATVAAYRPAGAAFDPRHATYVLYHGSEMVALEGDIRPGDLSALVERLESNAGRRFEGLRALLAEHGVVTFDDLVAQILQGGAEQPRLIAAAAGLSAGAAAASLAESPGQTNAPGARMRLVSLAVRGLPQWIIELLGEVAEQLLELAGSELADYLLDLLMPHLPGMLLCRGRTLIPKVCAYVFFPKSRLMDCIAQCQTTMDCFVDICMPLGGGMTDELASSFLDYLAGR